MKSLKLPLRILPSFSKSSEKKKKVEISKRAWKELNYENLEHNINEIKALKYKETEIMAVVKANAYGHGAVNISSFLEKIGIKSFAVASLDEAIELRKSGLKSDILILGYTPADRITQVIKYNFIQTITDYNHALQIDSLKLRKKVRCHLKINTGMNRLGESYLNYDNIKAMYHLNSLDVLGIFSHLAVADSLNDDDIAFTKHQIEAFDNCVNKLKHDHINTGKVHLQGSYGFSNYPHLKYDYIRMGIMMYGVKSSKGDVSLLDLKPVLTLKSLISSIRVINESESVSYGCTFKASKTMKIASVCIGYADGLSRSLSNTNYHVIINNCKCAIIGRICMDQLIVDITDVENVNVNDEVTIFGEDNNVEELSFLSNTITNESLTTLNKRISEAKSYSSNK